ncbi:MAG: CAAX prenyl protease-related protein [Pirellulales bacterium]
MDDHSSHSAAARIPHSPLPTSALSRHPWLPFLLPFIVYMAVGSLEPSPPQAPPGMEAIDEPNRLGIRYAHYPQIYTVKIVLTIAAMLYVLPGYLQFPLRISLLAIAVGLIGGVLWITICNLRLEEHLVDWLGPKNPLIGWLGLGERPSYNPLDQLAATPAWAYTFLAIRFVGLVLIVPVIEEFFLRGFLMRFVLREDWWNVPFGDVNTTAILLGTLFPVLYHPEKLAALVWFSLITWLMLRTKNIWDCVAAHAITNLLLGIYVVNQRQWQLW